MVLDEVGAESEGKWWEYGNGGRESGENKRAMIKDHDVNETKGTEKRNAQMKD